MEVSKYYKIAVFPELLIKMKKFKTFYEVRIVTHLKKIIQLPPTK